MISFLLRVTDVMLQGSVESSWFNTPSQSKQEFQLLITSALRIAFKLFMGLQGISKKVYFGLYK